MLFLYYFLLLLWLSFSLDSDCDVWFLNAQTDEKVFFGLNHNFGWVANLNHFSFGASIDLVADLSQFCSRQVWQKAVVSLRLIIEILNELLSVDL